MQSNAGWGVHLQAGGEPEGLWSPGELRAELGRVDAAGGGDDLGESSGVVTADAVEVDAEDEVDVVDRVGVGRFGVRVCERFSGVGVVCHMGEGAVDGDAGNQRRQRGRATLMRRPVTFPSVAAESSSVSSSAT